VPIYQCPWPLLPPFYQESSFILVTHCTATCTQKIPMVQLCNGDIDRPLKIEVFDHEKSGKHVPMGQVTAAAGSVLWC
jgi:oligoribonuclease NrnB/cAMP/cGMP phosphodiesterase (DHH superfamily)